MKKVTAKELDLIQRNAHHYPPKTALRAAWVARMAREHGVDQRTVYRYIRGSAS